MRILFFLLLVTGISPLEVSGQQKFTNTELARKLKTAHPDEDVIITSSRSAYEFYIENDQVKVRQQDHVELITLESNINYFYNIYYNDNISPGKTSMKYSSGRGSLKESHSCGNYEVDGIFYSDAKVCAYRLELLYEGSEVSIDNERTIEDARYLTKTFFHDQDPVTNRIITFTIPETVEVELYEINFEGYDVQKSREQVGGDVKYTYELREVKAYADEDNTLGMLHTYPHLIVATKSFQGSQGRTNVLASVEDLYSWYQKLVEEVDMDRTPFVAKVNELTSAAETGEDAIRSVYYWVQENIKYIAFEDGIAGFKPESAANVYHNRYGDCKGMAMLTREMLNEAGLDARLAWLGTNRIPYTYDLPSLAVDNHVICVVYAGDQQYILDPTERFIGLNDHAERIQGQELLIEDGENYIRQLVPSASPERNLWDRSEELTIKDGVLSGRGTIRISGEANSMLSVVNDRLEESDRQQLLRQIAVSEHHNTDIISLDEVSPFDREKPFSMSYSVALTNKVTGFDADMYIDLDWDEKYTDLELDEDRTSDYYFGRKVAERVQKALILPSGFKASHLPENLELTHKDIRIHISFEKKGNKIIYTKEFIVGSGKVSREDFEVWNDFIRRMKEVNNDQIVLTKIL